MGSRAVAVVPVSGLPAAAVGVRSMDSIVAALHPTAGQLTVEEDMAWRPR